MSCTSDQRDQGKLTVSDHLTMSFFNQLLTLWNGQSLSDNTKQQSIILRSVLGENSDDEDSDEQKINNSLQTYLRQEQPSDLLSKLQDPRNQAALEFVMKTYSDAPNSANSPDPKAEMAWAWFQTDASDKTWKTLIDRIDNRFYPLELQQRICHFMLRQLHTILPPQTSMWHHLAPGMSEETLGKVMHYLFKVMVVDVEHVQRHATKVQKMPLTDIIGNTVWGCKTSDLITFGEKAYSYVYSESAMDWLVFRAEGTTACVHVHLPDLSDPELFEKLCDCLSK
jgi:hypothetical protein